MEVTETAQGNDLKNVVIEIGSGELAATSFSTLVSEVFSQPNGLDDLRALAQNWDAEVGGALSSKTNSAVLQAGPPTSRVSSSPPVTTSNE